MSKNSSEGLGFILGLAAGTAIGVSVGMILAPHSGEESRRILNDRTSEYKARMAEKLAEYRAKAATTATELQERGKQYYNDVRSRIGNKEAEEVQIAETAADVITEAAVEEPAAEAAEETTEA